MNINNENKEVAVLLKERESLVISMFIRGLDKEVEKHLVFPIEKFALYSTEEKRISLLNAMSSIAIDTARAAKIKGIMPSSCDICLSPSSFIDKYIDKDNENCSINKQCHFSFKSSSRNSVQTAFEIIRHGMDGRT